MKSMNVVNIKKVQNETKEDEPKVSAVPFWKKPNNDANGLKIKLKGKEEQKPKANPVRPLPKSTIEEIERKL